MAGKSELSQERDAWVERELSKLLPAITEDTWPEVWVWAVISPQAA